MGHISFQDEILFPLFAIFLVSIPFDLYLTLLQILFFSPRILSKAKEKEREFKRNMEFSFEFGTSLFFIINIYYIFFEIE